MPPPVRAPFPFPSPHLSSGTLPLLATAPVPHHGLSRPTDISLPHPTTVKYQLYRKKMNIDMAPIVHRAAVQHMRLPGASRSLGHFFLLAISIQIHIHGCPRGVFPSDFQRSRVHYLKLPLQDSHSPTCPPPFRARIRWNEALNKRWRAIVSSITTIWRVRYSQRASSASAWPFHDTARR